MSLDLYFTKLIAGEGVDYDDFNITHSVCPMAREAGVYDVLWHPEKNGIERAGDLVRPISVALGEMEIDPERFKKYDDPRGWGTYDQFLNWLYDVLEFCEERRDWIVAADR